MHNGTNEVQQKRLQLRMCEEGAKSCGGCQIPICMPFTPGRFPLFSIFMIKGSRISTVNEGFWQETNGPQGRKQQKRKAAKLL